jgi:hypothetical protein
MKHYLLKKTRLKKTIVQRGMAWITQSFKLEIRWLGTMDLHTNVLACVTGYLLNHIVSEMIFVKIKKIKNNTKMEFT